jgi:hypothetical protein
LVREFRLVSARLAVVFCHTNTVAAGRSTSG